MSEQSADGSRASPTHRASKISPSRRSRERRPRGPTATAGEECPPASTEPEQASPQEAQEPVQASSSFPVTSLEATVNRPEASTASPDSERHDAREKITKEPVVSSVESTPAVAAQAAAFAVSPSTEKCPALDLPKRCLATGFRAIFALSDSRANGEGIGDRSRLLDTRRPDSG
ncbi:uncharacterized protein LOC144103247 [Amblyomma americanum]